MIEGLGYFWPRALKAESDVGTISGFERHIQVEFWCLGDLRNLNGWFQNFGIHEGGCGACTGGETTAKLPGPSGNNSLGQANTHPLWAVELVCPVHRAMLSELPIRSHGFLYCGRAWVFWVFVFPIGSWSKDSVQGWWLWKGKRELFSWWWIMAMGCHSPLLMILHVTTHIHRIPSGSSYFFYPVRWGSGLSSGGLTDRFYPWLHPQGQCAFSICAPTDGEQGSKVVPWARDGFLPSSLWRESRCVPVIMTAWSWFRWNGTESDGGTGSTKGKQMPR